MRYHPILFLAAMLLAAWPRYAAAQETRLDHISVVEMGEGDPVILIPGLATPRAVWSDVAADLAARHHVLLVQVNGFGGDAPGANLEDPVLEGIVADIRTYVDARGIERPAIIGHSMGGLIGMLLAAHTPDRVGRLMVVDALPFFAIQMAPPGADISVAEIEPMARRMREAVAARQANPPDPAVIEAEVAGMALRPGSRQRMAEWARAADARVVARAIYEIMTTDLRAGLSNVAAPVTVVYPWHAAGPGQERLDAFYRRQFTGIGDLRVVDIGDSAHFVMLDQPDLFLGAVRAFLAE